MIYRWKDNYRNYVSAEIAGKVCSELEEKGMLTTDNLVEVSRPVDAPLHKCFDWDDKHAAELYRKQQAGILISNLVFVPEDQGVTSEPIRIFYNIVDDEDGERTYESLPQILRSESKTETLLAQAYRDMRTFKAKYSTLSKLAKVMSVIDETLAEGER